MEKFINKLLNLLSDSDSDVCIKYTNIDGKESLSINGEDVLKEKAFDDSEVKNELSKFKKYWDTLTDCTVTSIVNSLSNKIDIKTVDELFSQDSFDEEDAELVAEYLDLFRIAIKEELYRQIKYFQEIIDNI